MRPSNSWEEGAFPRTFLTRSRKIAPDVLPTPWYGYSLYYLGAPYRWVHQEGRLCCAPKCAHRFERASFEIVMADRSLAAVAGEADSERGRVAVAPNKSLERTLI